MTVKPVTYLLVFLLISVIGINGDQDEGDAVIYRDPIELCENLKGDCMDSCNEDLMVPFSECPNGKICCYDS